MGGKKGESADVLFDFASRRTSKGPGPVERAAGRQLAAAVAAGELDETADALLMAHAVSLAARVDDCAERFDPYGAAQVSRELRETYRDLGLRYGPRVGAGSGDPLEGLFAQPPAAPAGAP